MNNQQYQNRKTRPHSSSYIQQPQRLQHYNPLNTQKNYEHGINYLPDEADSGKIRQTYKFPFYHPRKTNWSLKQKIKFLAFVNYYSELPNWGHDTKAIPIFKAMSVFIKSRAPEQCKSFNLSTRKNYKTIEEMIKEMSQELKLHENFKKLMDKYDLQIIAFQEEHKILQQNNLEQKEYFKKKLLQKQRQMNLDQSQNQDSPKDHTDEKIEKQQDQEQEQEEFNFKINITQLIKAKQAEQNNLKKQQQLTDRNHVVSKNNNHSNPIQKKYSQPNSNPPVVNTHLPYPPQNNKDNMNNVQIEQQGNVTNNLSQKHQYASNGQNNYSQDIKKVMEASKRQYAPFPGYPNYISSYSSGGRMGVPPYSNPMQFTMPPPGGLPYLLHGYPPCPYPGMQQNRYSNQFQNFKENKKSENRQVLQPYNKQMPVESQTYNNKVTNNLNKPLSQKRKQQILKVQQNWINYIVTALQLNWRKQQNKDLNCINPGTPDN